LIHLVGVPANTVRTIWPRLDAVYEEACKHSNGLLSKEAVFHRAVNGSGTLWITADDADTEVTATCLTSEIPLPNGRARIVEIIGGKVKYDILDFRAALEKRAKEDGCSALFFLIPRRWMPRLPDYRAASVLMSKELI
jgi:hypothetical protein